MLTAPTVTGYSPFWQMTGDLAAYSMSAGQARAKDSWLLRKFMQSWGTQAERAAFALLIGAAAGGTITTTLSQVAPPTGPSQAVPVPTSIGDFGGNRTINATSLINRASTAADVTELKKWVGTARSLLESGLTGATGANAATVSYTGSSMYLGTMHAGTPGFS